MITLELIYAVLRGLPARYLDFLDPPWPPFIQRIENALKNGQDPMSALRFALDSMNDWAKTVLRKTLSQVRPVMRLPGLSYRQKEALVALRSAGVVSLTQLSRVLVQDRSNTHKRLAVLVSKGYALKFFRSGGTYYFAITSPVEKSLKHSVNLLLDQLIDETENLPNLPQLPT
jgi:hypothetical protein